MQTEPWNDIKWLDARYPFMIQFKDVMSHPDLIEMIKANFEACINIEALQEFVN